MRAITLEVAVVSNACIVSWFQKIVVMCGINPTGARARSRRIMGTRAAIRRIT